MPKTDFRKEYYSPRYPVRRQHHIMGREPIANFIPNSSPGFGPESPSDFGKFLQLQGLLFLPWFLVWFVLKATCATFDLFAAIFMGKRTLGHLIKERFLAVSQGRGPSCLDPMSTLDQPQQLSCNFFSSFSPVLLSLYKGTAWPAAFTIAF